MWKTGKWIFHSGKPSLTGKLFLTFFGLLLVIVIRRWCRAGRRRLVTTHEQHFRLASRLSFAYLSPEGGGFSFKVCLLQKLLRCLLFRWTTTCSNFSFRLFFDDFTIFYDSSCTRWNQGENVGISRCWLWDKGWIWFVGSFFCSSHFSLLSWVKVLDSLLLLLIRHSTWANKWLDNFSHVIWCDANRLQGNWMCTAELNKWNE